MSSAKRLLLSALILLGAAACLVLCAWMFRLQSQAADERLNEVSTLADPSPFRVALTGHLDQMHLALQAYSQNPDPELVERIDVSRHAFEKSLQEFGKQSPRLFPAGARETLLTAFHPFETSVKQALDVSRERAEARGAWQGDFEQFLQTIQYRLRPLSRKDREGAAVRNDSLLNIENQWRAWQQNLAQFWAEPVPAAWAQAQKSQDQIDRHFALYSQVAGLAAERREIRVLHNLFVANVQRTDQIKALGKIAEGAFSQTETYRQDVLSVLARILPAMRPEELEQKKNALFRQVRLHSAAMVALALGTLAGSLLGLLGLVRLWRKPTGKGGPPPVPAGLHPQEEVVFEMDLKGRITGWSPAASRFYGYSEGEIKNQSISLLFASEDEITHLYEELKSGKQAGVDALHKTKAGAAFPVRIEFQPIKKGDQAAIRLICKRRCR